MRWYENIGLALIAAPVIAWMMLRHAACQAAAIIEERSHGLMLAAGRAFMLAAAVSCVLTMILALAVYWPVLLCRRSRT